MLPKEEAVRVLMRIAKDHRRVHKKTDPFYVLIATVLSQRTRDFNTDQAAEALFKRFPTVDDLSKAERKEVERLIKASGMYRQKAERIIEIAKELMKKYGGEVPSVREKLLQLRGVGRKTANIVLAVSFGIPTIAVDVHVHRIANRLGIVNTKKPNETEEELMKIMPKEYWTEVNGALVNFGQRICTPRNPKCGNCVFREVCEYARRNSSEVSGDGRQRS